MDPQACIQQLNIERWGYRWGQPWGGEEGRSGDLEGVGEPKGHNLWHPQLLAHVKDNVVVDVHHPAGVLVQQDVVQVAVTQAQQVPHLSPSQHMGYAVGVVLWGFC